MMRKAAAGAWAARPSSYRGAVVFGEGPIPCNVMMIGEAPGREEDLQGRPFVGASGQVLWEMVWRQLRLERGDVYVTNLCKVRPEPKPDGSDNPPTEDDIHYWLDSLRDEILRVKPKVIVCLGKYSFRALTGIEEDMSTVHGQTYPMSAWLGGRHLGLNMAPHIPYQQVVVVPVFHPASGLHNPDFLKYTWWDLERVRGVLDDDGFRAQIRKALTAPVKTNYSRLDSCGGRIDFDYPQIGIDTEGVPGSPECLTFSGEPGVAYLIRADDKSILRAFKSWLKRRRPKVVLHNALWDWKILCELGIDLLAMGLPWTDTMEYAYALQIEPKGLKALAYRHFGVKMREFEEVCYPYVNARRQLWFFDLSDKLYAAREGHDKSEVVYTKKGKPRKNPKITKCKCATCALHKLVLKWTMSVEEVDFGKRFEGLDDERRGVVDNLNLPPFPRMSLLYVPDREVVEYACADADLTNRLEPLLLGMVKDRGLEKTVAMDLGTWPMVFRMRQAGMVVDLKAVERLSNKLEEELEVTDELIRMASGNPDLNPGSPEQMADLFFRQLGMKSVKLTKGKTRESVADDVIQSLIKSNPDEPLLPAYSRRVEVAKLVTSYVRKIPGMVEDDGRVHPSLGTTSVVSGRYNDFMLTFPQRTDDGRAIRDCFVPPPGYVFGAWDLSQIELKVTAHLSQDPNMIAAFVAGEDLHDRTAKLMFKIPDKIFDKEKNPKHKSQRYVAKTLNFAILYGISAEGLYAQFKIAGLPYTLTDCQNFIDQWFETFVGVGKYMAQVWGETRIEGLVRDERSGRIRYLPGAAMDGSGWPFMSLKSSAHREAFSLRVQAFARSLLKESAIEIWDNVLPGYWDDGWDVQPIMDIHDELLFQVPDVAEMKVRLDHDIKAAMEMHKLRVPVVAEGKYGMSWGGVK